jgi:hypothetical protein
VVKVFGAVGEVRGNRINADGVVDGVLLLVRRFLVFRLLSVLSVVLVSSVFTVPVVLVTVVFVDVVGVGVVCVVGCRMATVLIHG